MHQLLTRKIAKSIRNAANQFFTNTTLNIYLTNAIHPNISTTTVTIANKPQQHLFRVMHSQTPIPLPQIHSTQLLNTTAHTLLSQTKTSTLIKVQLCINVKTDINKFPLLGKNFIVCITFYCNY